MKHSFNRDRQINLERAHSSLIEDSKKDDISFCQQITNDIIPTTLETQIDFDALFSKDLNKQDDI